MYNTQIPEPDKLPSSKQLFLSTLGALLVAALCLVIFILPAEYAVDPTGLGKKLGLLQMGEVKVQLYEEAEKQTIRPTAESVIMDSHHPDAASVPDQANTEIKPPKSSTQTVVLQPGQASEWKLIMDEGSIVHYTWVVDKGHVNYDTHGDNESINYHGYGKGRAVTGDQGSLQAAFDGSHGWFWRNRYSDTVTVTLEVSGEYHKLKKVL